MKEYTYQTIGRPAQAILTEKNSRFIAYAFSVNDEAEANQQLEEVKEEHPKASHHCYALRIGLEGDLFRANDDGEPSGSAGRPILGQIDSFELTNTLLVVVRYYGGVNLGVSGLIKAYKGSARLAIEEATIICKEVKETITVHIPYANVNHFQEWVNQQNIEIGKEEYSETGGTYSLTMSKEIVTEVNRHIQQLFQ